jgi:hypothetical protein
MSGFGRQQPTSRRFNPFAHSYRPLSSARTPRHAAAGEATGARHCFDGTQLDGDPIK